MAILINCPICGRRDISSHTEKCPDCGFKIRKYFIETYSKVENSSEIKIPEKPKITIGLIAFFAIAFGLLVLFGFLLPNLIAIILFLLDLLIIGMVAYLEIDAYHRFNLAKNDFDAYIRLLEDDKRKSEELSEKSAKRIAEIELQRKAELSKLPPCPICGSKNHVKRISTLNRSMSIAAVGLASSKIGKQYECTHCKHKW